MVTFFHTIFLKHFYKLFLQSQMSAEAPKITLCLAKLSTIHHHINIIGMQAVKSPTMRLVFCGLLACPLGNGGERQSTAYAAANSTCSNQLMVIPIKG